MSINLHLLFLSTSVCIAINGLLEAAASTSQLIYKNVEHLKLALQIRCIMGILHILWAILGNKALNNMRVWGLYAYSGGITLFSAIDVYLLYYLSPLGLEKAVSLLFIFIQQLAIYSGLEIAHNLQENVKNNIALLYLN